MASSASLKELSKAIKDFIVEPVLPLPDDLIDVIAAYLRRHQKYDEAASDRLQDELLAIFDKHVRGNPATSGAWLGIMRRLLPVLQTPERILVFFDVCKGLLDKISHNKNAINEAVAALMDVVTHAEEYHDLAEDESASNPFIDRLFTVWLDMYYPAYCAGQSDEHIERMVRDALGHFGKKRPKEFFASVNSFFVKRQYRKAMLRFFCEFLQSQPPHLHQIIHTPLFASLLTCLQQDTSSAVTSAALTALIMLLPHMPSSLVPHLPILFNIYARLLFWDPETTVGDSEGSASHPPESEETTPQTPQTPSRWEVCAREPETQDIAITHLGHYYTILYGLYPINFMDYIRKPHRYMRHANVDSPDEIEVQPTEIRHQSEQFRRCHLLHPNFYTLTVESEKTDFSRWIKSEPAEVVAECMALHFTPEAPARHAANRDSSHSGDSSIPINLQDDPEKFRSDAAGLLSRSLTTLDHWRESNLLSASCASSERSPSTVLRRGSLSSQRSTRNSAEMRSREGVAAVESPTLPPQLRSPAFHPQVHDMLRSNQHLKTGLHQSMANDSVPSLALSHPESAGDGSGIVVVPAPPPRVQSPVAGTAAAEGNAQIAQIAHLQTQILLLQNDLSFERYLKQQHMAHIGELRRRQTAEAATEAETQNFIMMNRQLKSRYEEAKMAEMQVRKESGNRRAISKKWEADLATKIKTLREDHKKTQSELESVRGELEESRQESEKLRKLVCEAEAKELNARQNLQSIEIHGLEIDRLEAEVKRLTFSEKDYQAKEVAREAAVLSATAAQNEVETLRVRMAAAEFDVHRTKRLYEGRVASLEAQLGRGRERREGLGTKANDALRDGLAASRARQAEQDKQYKMLLRKYTALQSTVLDMQSEAEQRRERSKGRETRALEEEDPADGDDEANRGPEEKEESADGHVDEEEEQDELEGEQQQQQQQQQQQTHREIPGSAPALERPADYLSASASAAPSPLLARPKPRRLLSEAEAYTAPSALSHASFPLTTTAATATALHPLQHAQSAGSERSASRSRFSEQRPFSGGFGSRIRKDSKDSKDSRDSRDSKDRQKEDGKKKEKRSTGLRSIRGLVNH